MKLTSLSALAASFPTVEVEYEDLLQYRYAPDGRGENKLIDCMGIVLEIYRRAGLGLPDARLSGGSIQKFADLFQEIPDPDTLYDLIHVRRGQDGLWVVVRPGVVLSVLKRIGVSTQKAIAVMGRSDATAYRVKPECLP
jgi:hypothetical protein